MIDFSSLKDITIPEGVVASIMCGNKVLWQKQKKLPYKRELLYLESTGTQWINTGILPTDTSIKSEVKIAYSSTNTGQLMGSGTSGTERFNFGIESGRFRFGYGSSWFDANNEVKTPDVEPHIWVLDAEAKAGYIDGVEQKTSFTYTPGGSRAFVLFARGSSTNSAENGNRTKGKLYYAKLWDKGNLVRHLIPVLDLADVPCLYDKVSGELFYNKGTGEFLYGELPRLPDEYQEVGYIESSGAQWIDTGVKLTSEHSVELDYQIVSVPKTNERKGLFGGLEANIARYGFIVSPTSRKLEYGYGVGNEYHQTDIPDTDRHVMKQGRNRVYVDDSLVHTFAEASFSMSSNAPLGSFNYTNYSPVSARYFSSKWWEADVLVRYFVPCYRKSDNKPGMYDLVTDSFFTNRGTGEFDYGDLSNLLSENQENEALEKFTMQHTDIDTELADAPFVEIVGDVSETLQNEDC